MKIHAETMESSISAEQIRFGRRYGKRAKMPFAEKWLGKLFAGSENRPPIDGPTMVPIDQTNGMTAYAFAKMGQHWYLCIGSLAYSRSCFGFVIISPTIVWITPMLPFRAPPNALPTRAIQKLVASPTDRSETIVPMQPRRTTGFLPSRSERAPQKLVHSSAHFLNGESRMKELIESYTEEQASARAKAAIRMPA